jgi:oligopeptidase B
VLGGSFDKDNYIEERVWATAKMELRCLFLWFIKTDKDGKTHCFMPMVHMVIPWMPIFHQQDSLLDRGFVYAIAFEGGGRQWYEGKIIKKKYV